MAMGLQGPMLVRDSYISMATANSLRTLNTGLICDFLKCVGVHLFRWRPQVGVRMVRPDSIEPVSLLQLPLQGSSPS
jgi:hypothetical protein